MVHVSVANSSSVIQHCFINDSSMNHWCLVDGASQASMWKNIENMDETFYINV